MLAAGIDVFSTVNVQHLESLNDQVAELTGVRVRETFPDAVLSGADEVVLVDVTPAALIERLQAGKVYKPERVPAALNGFFRVENLEALREVALRQVAEDVEARAARARAAAGARRAPRRPPRPGRRRAAARARHAAGVVAARRAARVALGAAARRGARHPHRPARRAASPPARAPSSSTRCAGSASLLGVDRARRGGRRRRRGGRRAVARERGTTYVLMGPPARRGAARRASRAPLAERLLRRLPGVDVRVVADRSRSGSA